MDSGSALPVRPAAEPRLDDITDEEHAAECVDSIRTGPQSRFDVSAVNQSVRDKGSVHQRVCEQFPICLQLFNIEAGGIAFRSAQPDPVGNTSRKGQPHQTPSAAPMAEEIGGQLQAEFNQRLGYQGMYGLVRAGQGEAFAYLDHVHEVRDLRELGRGQSCRCARPDRQETGGIEPLMAQPVESCLALPDAADSGGLPRSCDDLGKAFCEHPPDRFAGQTGRGEEFMPRAPSEPVATHVISEDERVAGFEKQVVASLSREDGAAGQAKTRSTVRVRPSPQEFPEGPC